MLEMLVNRFDLYLALQVGVVEQTVRELLAPI